MQTLLLCLTEFLLDYDIETPRTAAHISLFKSTFHNIRLRYVTPVYGGVFVIHDPTSRYLDAS